MATKTKAPETIEVPYVEFDEDAPVAVSQPEIPAKEPEWVKEVAVAVLKAPAPTVGLPPLKIGMDLRQMGAVFAASGFFNDSRSEAQAIVKILAGAELGISPIAAMTGVFIVEGKVTLGANLVAGIIRRSGNYDYRAVKMTNEACEIEFSRKFEGKWRVEGLMAFTIEDARNAGLVKDRSAWMKFPQSMCFARAMTAGARAFCPDIFAGPVYTAEELGAPVDDEGNIVVAEETPYAPTQAGGGSQSATPPQAPPYVAPARPQAPSTQGGATAQPEFRCSMNFVMYLRSGRNGQFWSCSHQVDGKYHNESRDYVEPRPDNVSSDGEIKRGVDITVPVLFAALKAMGAGGQHLRQVMGDAFTPQTVLDGGVAQQPDWAVQIEAWRNATKKSNEDLASLAIAAKQREGTQRTLAERLAEPVAQSALVQAAVRAGAQVVDVEAVGLPWQPTTEAEIMEPDEEDFDV